MPPRACPKRPSARLRTPGADRPSALGVSDRCWIQDHRESLMGAALGDRKTHRSPRGKSGAGRGLLARTAWGGRPGGQSPRRHRLHSRGGTFCHVFPKFLVCGIGRVGAERREGLQADLLLGGAGIVDAPRRGRGSVAQRRANCEAVAERARVRANGPRCFTVNERRTASTSMARLPLQILMTSARVLGDVQASVRTFRVRWGT